MNRLLIAAVSLAVAICVSGVATDGDCAPEVTYPNGGEELLIGCVYALDWDETAEEFAPDSVYIAVYTDTPTRIYLLDWKLVENNGDYDWTVEDFPSTCIFEVCYLVPPEPPNNECDTSDSAFTVRYKVFPEDCP
jgi:hypothetical protein